MEQLIIKHHKRMGRLSEFVKSRDTSLTLGRGYHNDVILSDYFIAPDQLRFDYEDGKWQLKVLDYTNPVFINNKPVTEDTVTINGGDELMVGRTHLVLLTSDQPVERTRKLIRSNWVAHRGLRIALPILAMVVAVLMDLFSEYLSTAGKIRWGELFAGGMVYAIMIALWAGAWALAGRLLHHKPNFFLQLFYTALILAGMTFGAIFAGYTEYAFSSRGFGNMVEIGFLVFVFSLLLRVNLTYATELKRRGLISFSLVAILTVVVISIDTLRTREFSTRPDYSQSVKPPLVKWSTDKTLKEYFNGVDAQFKMLQEESK